MQCIRKFCLQVYDRLHRDRINTTYEKTTIIRNQRHYFKYHSNTYSKFYLLLKEKSNFKCLYFCFLRKTRDFLQKFKDISLKKYTINF